MVRPDPRAHHIETSVDLFGRECDVVVEGAYDPGDPPIHDREHPLVGPGSPARFSPYRVLLRPVCGARAPGADMVYVPWFEVPVAVAPASLIEAWQRQFLDERKGR